MFHRFGAITLALLLLPNFALALDKNDYFAISVVDEQTGRGVPLVQLKTTNDICYYTDSNGLVAFYEPGLMGQTVYFHVQSDGYEFPKDGFGFRGKALQVKAGESATLRIKRLNIAERLYRLTGGDIYRDTVLLGRTPPTKSPLLNGLVFGQDSVENAVYRSKIHWFWGDTNKPSYPLGNYNVPGATSLLPAQGGLDPSLGVDLSYYVDDKGFARPEAQMAGAGPTWIGGLVVLKDGTRERMLASYVKIRNQLEVYARGAVEFDDDTQRFRKVADFPLKSPAFPEGHPFLHTDGGVEYVYFPKPFPLVRVRATPDDFKDLSRYESFTCLQEGSNTQEAKLDRTADGKLRYAWKRNTPALNQNDQKKLVASGAMKASEGLLQFRDHVTGKPVTAHNGSVYWNPYRGRWVMIDCELGGTSMLGEIWYAEADAPTGPWTYAVKVLTHNKYSFYNPKQDPMFDQDGGRVIYFEGTYTHTFSGNTFQTPRYDYNQIMYRLDQADPRLVLPVPIYASGAEKGPPRFQTRRDGEAPPALNEISFFAPDRAAPGLVAVYQATDGTGALRVAAGNGTRDAGATKATFYALPADGKNAPATSVPLYEWVSEDGNCRLYSTQAELKHDGYRRAAEPICRVWRSPYLAEFKR
jgi:hypothetical protein